jgi:hypothetical protein
MKTLIGLKIVEVRKATEPELELMGLDEPPTVILLENGIMLFALRDAEGNGPGTMIALFTEQKLQYYVEPEK